MTNAKRIEQEKSLSSEEMKMMSSVFGTNITRAASLTLSTGSWKREET
jgi:hypothetical protein